MIAALLSAGVFVAVPLTGRVAMGRLGTAVPTIARPSVWVAAGVAIWSVPLLGLLILGVYHAELVGAAGWLTVAALLVARRVGRPGIPRLSKWDWVVLAGLALAAVLAAAFPADPLTAAAVADQNTYASHALYIAHHGRLDVPLPWPAGDPAPPGFAGYPGVYFTLPSLTVQFAHLFPAWLAQTFAAAGYGALMRLNVLVGLLALLAVYGLAKRFVRPSFAGFGILFLAFNPAQIWISRQALTEIPTQLLIWCGLLLLVAYLARGRPAIGAWAGILLGAAAFVRIDVFLLVPFLFMGHALWRVATRGRGAQPSWRPIYLASMPLFTLALALYATLSQPYLLELSTQILEVGALGVVGAGLLGLTYVDRLSGFAASALANRRVVLGMLVLIAAVAAYAYFIRPILPPFDVIHAPGRPTDGLRSYVEDALANLGRYLTPGVVWAGLLGWSLVFMALGRRSRAAVRAAPLLVVAIGMTAVYSWNQSVFPLHFWAIRRFVPEIIPAIILFACVGTAWLIDRFSRPGRRLALGLIAPLLVVWTWYIGAPMYVTPQGAGSYAALSQFAQSLPTSGYVFAVDGDFEALHYWMPLWLVFDRPVIPLYYFDDTARTEAIAQLSAASADHPITLVTAAYDFRMGAVVGTRVAQVSWSGQYMAETTNPVSRTVSEQHNTLTLIRATGLNTIGVPFGGAPQWVAPVTGFHPAQLVDGRALRWTDGDGKIAIPVEGNETPGRLSVSIADTGPGGGPLRITLNGVTLFDAVVAAGPWSGQFDLTGVGNLHAGDMANVEIASDTFSGVPLNSADRETAFGVQVDSVILLPGTQ